MQAMIVHIHIGAAGDMCRREMNRVATTYPVGARIAADARRC
jgi:hypothetical protein